MTLQISERLEKAILFARGEEDGIAWLRTLPRRVDAYLRRWDLSPLHVAEGGAMSCCLFCQTSSGEEAVLKIPFDAASGRLEARSLARWARSAASPEILATAPSSGVFLMRRIRPGTTATPAGTAHDSDQFCDLITRMTRPELGTLRGLKRLDDVTAMRFDWADERFRDPGYDLQSQQMPGVHHLRTRLEATCRHPQIIHGDLQAKNVLIGPDDTWQAIDPFTCRGDLNAEAALWAVLQDNTSRIQDRVSELADCPMLDENRLRAWCYIYAVAEYRAYLPTTTQRLREFTTTLHWTDLATPLNLQ
jgi:streptomycin 6-kinase